MCSSRLAGSSFLAPNRGDDRPERNAHDADHGDHEEQKASRKLVALVKAFEKADRSGNEKHWFGDSHVCSLCGSKVASVLRPSLSQEMDCITDTAPGRKNGYRTSGGLRPLPFTYPAQ